MLKVLYSKDDLLIMSTVSPFTLFYVYQMVWKMGEYHLVTLMWQHDTSQTNYIL